MQVDDFKFVGTLFVIFGAAELAVGFSQASAIGGRGELYPLFLIVVGAVTMSTGIATFRRRWWTKYAVGLAAFLAAPSFPFGTVIAAVAFIAIGRDWRRLHGERQARKDELNGRADPLQKSR